MTEFTVGQRVRIMKMQRAKLEVNGLIVFDFDKARGDTAIVKEIVRDRYIKVVVCLDRPNAGTMLLSPRQLKPAHVTRTAAGAGQVTR